jgi:hypothetical protein
MRELSNEETKAVSGGIVTSSTTLSTTLNGVTTTYSFSQTGSNFTFIDVATVNGVLVRNNQGSG